MASKRTPKKAADKNQFAKVRHDHRSETAEDYCEAIADIAERQGVCRVRDLAEYMRVTHVTVTKIVRRLATNALVHKQPRGPIALAPPGAALAHACRERHAIVLRFLRLLGVSESAAARDAEGIEHHAGEESLRAMKRFVARHTINAKR